MANKARRDMRVAVLAGGISDEREISLASGGNVVNALREAGYGVVELIDPSSPDFLAEMAEGCWDVAFIALHGRGGEDGMTQHVLEFMGIPYTASSPLASGIAMDKDLSKLLYRRAGLPVAPSVTFGRTDMPTVEQIVDVVGPQSFVKPVVNGSSYGISLVKDPLPVAPSVTFGRTDMPTVEQIVDVVGPQSFVKPVVNGSSYGISLVKDPSELAAAIELAFEHGEKVMVERRVFGVECSVAAVGDGDTLRALPVVEILMPGQSEFYDLEVKYADPTDIHRIPADLSVAAVGDGDTLRALPVVEILMPGQSEFYDLEVKYADPTDIHRIPADLPEDVYAQVQDIACRAHEALGLYGISRTDVIVTEDGPVILETNNVPGMTPESLVPDEARHAGIAFCDLCAELVDLALERAGR